MTSRLEWRFRALASARRTQGLVDTGPSLIVAPHPDDETLGCGGLIALKRRAGQTVSIAVMTDGGASHAQFLERGELVQLRAEEVRAAARVLGVDPHDVHLLGFPDGGLENVRAQAIERLSALVARLGPRQVFVPFAGDVQPDHVATHRIALAAKRHSGVEVAELVEYPVWYWHHWPWVTLPASWSGRRRALHQALSHGLGLGMKMHFRTRLDIRAVLDCKKEALGAHRTQTERLVPDTAWPTLEDVSGGTFLRCFLFGFELFRRRPWPGAPPAAAGGSTGPGGSARPGGEDRE